MAEPDGQAFEACGTLSADGGRGVLRLEITAPASAVEVWAALTEAPRLAAWYGRVEGDLRVGGRFHALLFPSGWEGDGQVLACEPRRRLRIESGEPGEATTSDELELTREGEGRTRIALTRIRPSSAMLGAYATGTQLHLENLVAHVAGRGLVDTDVFWTAMRPRYEALAAALEPSGTP